MCEDFTQFITDVFSNALQVEDPNIKPLLYILITKLRRDYLKDIDQVTFIKSILSDFQIYPNNYNISIIMLLLLILKAKFKLIEYKELVMILNITSTDKLYQEFLEIYKNEKSLDYYLSSTIFNTLIPEETLLSKLRISLLSHASEYDHHIDYLSFINFDRHDVLKEQLKEIFSINSNQMITLYGPGNSGKTTFAKLFTKDVIVFEIDETMEINVFFF
jgi:hypothetical protein